MGVTATFAIAAFVVVIRFRSDSTIYAPWTMMSWAGGSSIRNGMTPEEVTRILGQPLSIEPFGGEIHWNYLGSWDVSEPVALESVLGRSLSPRQGAIGRSRGASAPVSNRRATHRITRGSSARRDPAVAGSQPAPVFDGGEVRGRVAVRGADAPRLRPIAPSGASGTDS